MNQIFLLFIIPLLSFFSVLLDTSFFSFYEVAGATVISSFVIMIIFSIFGYRRIALLFAACSVLFMAAFSSIPVYLLVIIYFGIPLIIFYIRTKLYFESNFGLAVLTLMLSSLLFRLLLLPMNMQFTADLALSIIIFPVINTLLGIILFVLGKRWFWNKKLID